MDPAKQIEATWSMIDNCFDLEPRAYFEEQATINGFESPLAMAVFYLWKRDPKVEQLMQENERLKEVMEEAHRHEHELIDASNMELEKRRKAERDLAERDLFPPADVQRSTVRVCARLVCEKCRLGVTLCDPALGIHHIWEDGPFGMSEECKAMELRRSFPEAFGK